MPLPPSSEVAVIGGGPGGLMAAEVLAEAGAVVTVYEAMPSVGRKFLLAGRGGLNLTHSEPVEQFATRYGAAEAVIGPTISAFSPNDLAGWCAGLGQDTFVGSSRRVFPAGFRATPLLRAWLARLADLGVQFRVRHEWQGWGGAPNELLLADHRGVQNTVHANAVLFALGGGSWPRSGSNGVWVEEFARHDIDVVRLRPANCGFLTQWTDGYRERFGGTPLKNVAMTFACTTVRGEALITAAGIEGGPVYGVSAELRDEIERVGRAMVHIDLHPDLTADALVQRLTRAVPTGASRSMSAVLRAGTGLAPVAVGLVREATRNVLPKDIDGLAQLLKAVPLMLTGIAPLERAISSAGGIALHEIDESFMLRRQPGCFVAGEMLDWEAPTGGFLLQGTFSTAVAAAKGAIRWLESPTLSPHGPC